jgi:hypothetical protein
MLSHLGLRTMPYIDGCCKGKTLLELEETHSGNGKDQGIAKGC